MNHQNEKFDKIYDNLRNHLLYDTYIQEFSKALTEAITEGYDINYAPVNHYYETLLMTAVSMRGVSSDMCLCLLDHGADPNLTDRLGQNCLALAAFYRDSGKEDDLLLQRILELTKDINAKDVNGRTAFNAFLAGHIILHNYGDNYEDKLLMLLEAGLECPLSELERTKKEYAHDRAIVARADRIQAYIERYNKQKELERETLESGLNEFMR